MMTIARRSLLSHQQLPLRFLRALSSSPTPKPTPTNPIIDRTKFFGIGNFKSAVMDKFSEYSSLWKTIKSLSAKFTIGDRITIRNRNSGEIMFQGVVKNMGLRSTTITPRDRQFEEKEIPNETFENNHIDNNSRQYPPITYPLALSILSHLLDASNKTMDSMIHLIDNMIDGMDKLVDAVVNKQKVEETKVAFWHLIDLTKKMKRMVETMEHLIDAKEKIINAMEKSQKEEEKFREFIKRSREMMRKEIDAMKKMIDLLELAIELEWRKKVANTKK